MRLDLDPVYFPTAVGAAADLNLTELPSEIGAPADFTLRFVENAERLALGADAMPLVHSDADDMPISGLPDLRRRERLGAVARFVAFELR